MTTAEPRAQPYPHTLTLRHEHTVQVRPMEVTDADALHTFFCRIPEEDLLFLRRDVTNREVIESWALDVAAGQTFTLLAEAHGQVVGEASVHRSRAPWSGHVGEIRVVVDATHRRVGLGSALVQAIFLEALRLGIEKIVAEMTPDQTAAINVFQKLGFQPEGLFRAHVRDRTGAKRDLIVMAHEVSAAGTLLAHYGVAEALHG
jgi:RimJ/RimL family protein N-acetyltransferase